MIFFITIFRQKTNKENKKTENNLPKAIGGALVLPKPKACRSKRLLGLPAISSISLL
jgi:hypothetical protein